MLTRSMPAALVGAAGIFAGVLTQTTTEGALSLTLVGLMYAAYLLVGVLILRVHPGHVVGRIMLVGGAVAAAGSGLLETGWAHLQSAPGSTWAQLAATVGATARGVGWFAVILLLPLVFPDGRREGPPRVSSAAWVTGCAVLVLDATAGLLDPAQTDLRLSGVNNPIGLPARTQAVFDALLGLMLLLALVTIVLALVCLVAQWRHGGSLDRQRLLWFALAFALPVTVLVLSAWDLGTPEMFALVSLPLPVAIGVACLQHRLYDLDLVLNRSLTYGSLSVVIAALYALTVGGVGAMLRQQGASWLPWVAAGVVAVTFAPLREALQGAANRLTYGRWSQPAEVLAATGRRLADATDVPALLRSLTAELGTGLGLSYIEILDAEGKSLANHGATSASTESVPLQAYGAPVGVLQWCGRDLRAADRALLHDVAGQLGAVVHAGALLHSLRVSQERLVLAREEERRRLRRDLHDGLGPALAGLTLQVDTLRHQLAVAGPDAADEHLLTLRSGIQSTVLDVRKIVEGLRPPALDELGLAGALRQLSRRADTPAGPSVHFDLEVTVEGGLGLPAAVEVAAYRIAAEALTNALTHAHADHVGVRVRNDRVDLLLEVCDDGAGTVGIRDGGIGLASMRERAEEIGGSLLVTSTAGVGTTVRATLPVGLTPHSSLEEHR